MASKVQGSLEQIDGADQARVDRFVRKANADATVLAYESSWNLFIQWCRANAYEALPATPKTVAAYLTGLAEKGSEATGGKPLSKSSLKKKLAAIVFAHRQAELPPPTRQDGADELIKVMEGIARDKTLPTRGKKNAAVADILNEMLEANAGGDLRACRNRALLAIGMAGALRRSELVGIQYGDLTFSSDGIRLLIPYSKGDQKGKGQKISIPRGEGFNAVGHLRRWLEVSGIASGPVFRKLTPQGRLGGAAMSAQGVALVVKASIRAAGSDLDPAEFSAHSLRSGFLTEAARRGQSPFAMQRQSRHKSLDMVSEYVRDQDDLKDHPGSSFT